MNAIIDAFARILAYGFLVTAICQFILLLLQPKMETALTNASPEGRHLLYENASMMVKVTRLALIVFPIMFVIMALILHNLLGANLVLLIALFGLMIVNFVEYFISQIRRVKALREETDIH
jgi:hypothetical protein